MICKRCNGVDINIIDSKHGLRYVCDTCHTEQYSEDEVSVFQREIVCRSENSLKRKKWFTILGIRMYKTCLNLCK